MATYKDGENPLLTKENGQIERYLRDTPGSFQEPRDIALHQESLAPIPQILCLWHRSLLPLLKGQLFSSGALLWLSEKFSSRHAPRLRRHLQCRYLRRWICLNYFFPRLGWDIFPSPFIFFSFFECRFYEYCILDVSSS